MRTFIKEFNVTLTPSQKSAISTAFRAKCYAVVNEELRSARLVVNYFDAKEVEVILYKEVKTVWLPVMKGYVGKRGRTYIAYCL